MTNIMDLVKGQLSEGLLDQLTNQIGASDRRQTAQATNGIVEILVAQLAKNASDRNGAESLANALEKDHDGSIFDQLNDYLGGNAQVRNQNPRMTNGSGILKHILGERRTTAADAVSQMSGLDNKQTGNLMEMLAPIVMGALGRTKRTNNLDAGGLSDILGGILNNQRQRGGNPTMDMLKNFIDKDGDGNIMDEVGGFLGKLFKK